MSTLLRVEGLSKRYGKLQALSDISFELAAGELVAVIGPNGAGKTTLLSIIAHSQAPNAGQVHSAQRIGWTPQQPALYSKLSVEENLRLFARLEGVADVPRAVARMLEQIGLTARAREPVERLSGGNRQRVNVAIGLIADPPVVALDEPSAALDPPQRERLWAFLEQLVERGRSVLFSTHNVSEAQRHATRVLVMAGGHLLFDGTPDELLSAARERPLSGAPELREQGLPGDLEQALVRFLELHACEPQPEGAAA